VPIGTHFSAWSIHGDKSDDCPIGTGQFAVHMVTYSTQ
jgi:hypothetical protein